MKKNFIGLLFFVLFFAIRGNAQDDTLLKQRLLGKKNFAEVMNTVMTYYKDPATIDRLGDKVVTRNLKKWSRYEWYMSSRLGPNGEFVNINQKLFDAARPHVNDPARSNPDPSNIMESTGGNWSVVGPINTDAGIGRVDRLAFHPSDPGIVYAGAAGGGLWRTTDAGANWTNLTPDLPCLGISGIAIDPNNTNTIYILTGDGDSDVSGLVEDFGYMRFSIGVLRSTDGGARWTRLGEFPGVSNAMIGYRLVMHPTNSDILFACTSEGLFRTNDGGSSWTAVETTGGRFYNMKFRPTGTDTCYAVANNGATARFYRSFNEGVDWETDPVINNLINAPTSRIELAVAASNPNMVYLLGGGVPGNGQFAGLYRSTNSGMSFGPQAQSTTPNILGRSNTGADNQTQSTYDLALAVSNVSGTTVISGAIEVWSSTTSGTAWIYRGNNVHDDVHDIGFHPADNMLWVATDGGVYSSNNNGATWISHFEGMSISQFYRMAVRPSDYLEMIAGAQDNGVKRRDNGTSSFTQIGGADGYCVGYDAANNDIYYAIQNSGLTRFTNNGAGNSTLVPNLRFFTNMAVHTSVANTVFLASDTFRTVANGNVTNYIAANMPRGGWYIKTCPSNGNRIYMAGGACPAPTVTNPLPGCYQATTGVLRRSDDGGVTWPVNNILSSDNGFPLTFPKITGINVDPTNSLKVWITFGGFTDNVKVYYADYNASPGGNWINMSGSLPNVPVNCIALDNNNNAYIGTDNGIYYRGTGMNDWVPFYNNLPYVPVTDLVISEADNRIRAATFGRGIWASDLYTTCVTDLNVTGTLEGQEFYEASNAITSTASLLTSEGSKVQMRGGQEVLLQDGFSAKETTHFRAAIGPCGSGGVAGFRIATDDSRVKLPPRQYLTPTGGNRSMVHIISTNNGETHFEVDQKQPGTTEIILTDETGNILRRKTIPVSPGEKRKDSISSTGLAPGIYYLDVLLDNRVEHMQELVIR
jgi:hypothetical protein